MEQQSPYPRKAMLPTIPKQKNQKQKSEIVSTHHCVEAKPRFCRTHQAHDVSMSDDTTLGSSSRATSVDNIGWMLGLQRYLQGQIWIMSKFTLNRFPAKDFYVCVKELRNQRFHN